MRNTVLILLVFILVFAIIYYAKNGGEAAQFTNYEVELATVNDNIKKFGQYYNKAVLQQGLDTLTSATVLHHKALLDSLQFQNEKTQNQLIYKALQRPI